MNLLSISFQNLKNKPLSSFLSVLLMALGIAIISLLLLLGKQLEDKFKNNLKGIDMVIGAKGSPLQLILSSIYQIDSPTGNIKLSEANGITHNPLIKKAIPLSMGDSYQGYRIIGTTLQYPEHFEAKLSEGKLFEASMECVAGANVAKALGLKMGDTFVGTHGYDNEGDKHDALKYKIVGILATNNSVLDQVILTPLESVWAVHEAHEQTALEPSMPISEPEITAMLVKFRNPMGLMAIPHNINANTKMQAALPSIEINRLFDLLGLGLSTLQAIALVIMIVAGISVFVALYNSLKERNYEMALMLSMGASRSKLFLLLLLEGLMVALIGYILGIGLSRIALTLLAGQAEKNFHYDFEVTTLLPEEVLLLVGAVGIGILAAAIPSLSVYQMNISKTLAEE